MTRKQDPSNKADAPNLPCFPCWKLDPKPNCLAKDCKGILKRIKFYAAFQKAINSFKTGLYLVPIIVKIAQVAVYRIDCILLRYHARAILIQKLSLLVCEGWTFAKSYLPDFRGPGRIHLVVHDVRSK